jgi:murein L,D-transpeptidase YcbB/YkuD
VIHEERIITGKVDTQTPIFSDLMEHIVFHPFWGVPDSIKVKEVWPSLAGGGSMVERNGLRVQYNGRDVDPRSINWSSNDIRKFHVYQPPGPNNVLGVVKFMFPNKHQVYMHDTPTKNLFNSTQRTFSHGCMRVRNPMRLAEVILQEDKGWDAARVNGLVKGGPQNNHIYLDRKIPVHVTYFTAVVGDDGKLRMLPDVYGHEPKIQMGIDGKAHLIVKKKPSLTPPDAIASMAEAKQNSPLASWMKQVFGNF